MTTQLRVAGCWRYPVSPTRRLYDDPGLSASLSAWLGHDVSIRRATPGMQLSYDMTFDPSTTTPNSSRSRHRPERSTTGWAASSASASHETGLGGTADVDRRL